MSAPKPMAQAYQLNKGSDEWVWSDLEYPEDGYRGPFDSKQSAEYDAEREGYEVMEEQRR